MKNKKGRPTMYDKKMKRTAIYLPEYIREWLSQQPGESMSDIIRNIIETNMNTKHVN